jgi:hypothetical protein
MRPRFHSRLGSTELGRDIEGGCICKNERSQQIILDRLPHVTSDLLHDRLSLDLQPQLYKPADGFRAPWQIVLLPPPVVQLLSHVGLNANHYRLSGDRGTLLPWFRGIMS